MAKTTRKSFENSERKIIYAKNVSKADTEGIIKLYDELAPNEKLRTIDIKMIVEEAFPMFEKTIGKNDFDKVKRYFGIEYKPNLKSSGEIKMLIAKLRTIENAQYYLMGYKELVKRIAEKLYNAPEGMSDLEKAKIIRMFFIIFANNENFMEDYVYKGLPNNQKRIVFSEKKAIDNNKLVIRPEELFELFNMKITYSEGYYYDMMIMYLKKMYQEKNKYKKELVEVLKFAELEYDYKTNTFKSVNKTMVGATFGKIRTLKQKIFKMSASYPLEIFCNKKFVKENLDLTELYIVYKTLTASSWKENAKTVKYTYKCISGSRYIEKEANYYEVFENFLIADEDEAERWILFFEYLAKYEIILNTVVDGNGEKLQKAKEYNVGVFKSAIKFAMEAGYISQQTPVIRDFEVVDKLLILNDAERKFLDFKRKKVTAEVLKNLLGIDEKFEKNVLQIKNVEETEKEKADSLLKCIINFALNNDYARAETDIDINLIENIFITNNKNIVEKYAKGEIKESEFKKKIGFENDFAETYFNVSKIDVKKIETKLLEIKKHGRKDLVRRSKLLILLYCYVINNGIACGQKNKIPKRNKGLKPEILEKLIA